MTYDSTQLDAELRAAGLPLAGCDSTGRVTWPVGVTPTPAQLATIQAVLAAHDPEKAAKDKAAAEVLVKQWLLDLDDLSEARRRVAIAGILRYLVGMSPYNTGKKQK